MNDENPENSLLREIAFMLLALSPIPIFLIEAHFAARHATQFMETLVKGTCFLYAPIVSFGGAHGIARNLRPGEEPSGVVTFFGGLAFLFVNAVVTVAIGCSGSRL